MPSSGSKSNESQNGVIEAIERASEEVKAAGDPAFANKLATRRLPNAVERAAIEKARRRTKTARRALPCTLRILRRRTRAIYVVASKASS